MPRNIIREIVHKTGLAWTIATGFLWIMAIVFGIAGTTVVKAAPAKPVNPSLPQQEVKQDPGEWKKVLEAAKKEGKLVMSGDSSQEWRKALVDLFREDHPEIQIEYTGVSGRDFAMRIRQEREMGQKLWDLRGGGTTTLYEMKNDGFLEPIRPLLSPEIADSSKWIGGLDNLFGDKENTFVPAYLMTTDATTVVNRDFIKEAELKSSGQLLDPKFKGKIVIETPTAGASFSAMGNFAFMYGESFVRDFLSRQDVLVTNDRRQQAEWVVRGKYPIAVGFNDTQLIPFVKQGLGKNVVKLPDKIIPVSSGFGALCLLKDAPHPNAARVYINWLLSQNTQMKLSRILLLNSLRRDVPPIEKELAVDPAHLSNYRFYSTEANREIDLRLTPLIKEALKK